MNELEELLGILREEGWHTSDLTDLTADSGTPWWSWHLTKRYNGHVLTSVSAQGATLLEAVNHARGKAREWEAAEQINPTRCIHCGGPFVPGMPGWWCPVCDAPGAKP